MVDEYVVVGQADFQAAISQLVVSRKWRVLAALGLGLEPCSKESYM